MNLQMDEAPEYVRWNKFVRQALSCLDLKSLTWSHLPSSGGYYDQDPFFMCIWEAVRDAYMSIISNPKERQEVENTWQK